MLSLCTYCNNTIEIHKDHIIPFAYSSISKNPNRKRGHWLEPACRECNSLLGSKYLPSIEQRATYLAKKYKNRYQSVLHFNKDKWSDKELNDLGESMRIFICDSQRMKEKIQDRIACCERQAKKPN